MDTGGQTTPRKQDLASVARDIIDSNAYMTLATADENGRPWASPVWYAAEGYEHFYWSRLRRRDTHATSLRVPR